MAGHVDNEFAFCKWANDAGYDYASKEADKATVKDGKVVEDNAIVEAWKKVKEADVSSTNALATRDKVQEASKSDSDKSRLGTLEGLDASEINLSNRTMPVTIITAGMGNMVDKHYYTPDCLRKAVDEKIFEGAKSYRNHLTDKEELESYGLRKLEDQCGYISDVRLTQDGQKIVGMYHFMDNATGSDVMKEAIVSLKYKKQYPDKKPLMGLSHVSRGPCKKVTMNGSTVKLVEQIKVCNSVDAVSDPARGGEFNERLLESEQKGKDAMALFKRNDEKMKAATEAHKALRAKLHEDHKAPLDDVVQKHLDAHEPVEPDQAGKDVEAKKKEAEVMADEARKKESEAKSALKSCESARKIYGAEFEKLAESIREEVREEEAKKYAGKNLDFAAERAKIASLKEENRILVSEKVARVKLQESGLSEKLLDLSELLGKSSDEMDQVIKVRKNLIEGLKEGNIVGAGSSFKAHGSTEDADLVESRKVIQKRGIAKK
jgi:hypothetical protein